MVTLTKPHYGGRIDIRDANDPRTRIVNLIPEGSQVLEVGCGSGSIASYLLHTKKCLVIAIEPDPVMAAEAHSSGVEVFQGQIEDPDIQQKIAGRAPFDVVIFADVLEHLRDPWTVLKQVHLWISENGRLLASIPNVAHWSIRLSLLFGKWEYTEGYLMDRTHLRWFTRRSLLQLFEESGYQVTEFQVRWAPFPGDRLWRRLIPGRARLYAFLANRWPGFFGYQFIVGAELSRV